MKNQIWLIATLLSLLAFMGCSENDLNEGGSDYYDELRTKLGSLEEDRVKTYSDLDEETKHNLWISKLDQVLSEVALSEEIENILLNMQIFLKEGRDNNKSFAGSEHLYNLGIELTYLINDEQFIKLLATLDDYNENDLSEHVGRAGGASFVRSEIQEKKESLKRSMNEAQNVNRSFLPPPELDCDCNWTCQLWGDPDCDCTPTTYGCGLFWLWSCIGAYAC